MPNFGVKNSKGSSKSSNKAPPSANEVAGAKTMISANERQAEQENYVIDEEPPRKIAPFADGLVSAKLNGLVIIPRAGGEEVELFRGFLRHFAAVAPFAGNIVSKASFMRKKGGRLL